MTYLYGVNFVKVARGSTLQLTVESVWEDVDTSSKFDFTGATFLFTIKRYRDDQVPLFHARGVAGVRFVVDSPKSGKVVFSMTGTETAALPSGTHYYDFWVLDTAGQSYQLVENAEFEVTQGITIR